MRHHGLDRCPAAFSLLVQLASLLLVLSCTPRSAEVKPVDNVDRIQFEGPNSLSEFREKYAHLIDQKLIYPESSDDVETLVIAAREEGLATENIKRNLMHLFAEEDLGHYLLEDMYASLSSRPHEVVIAQLEDVRTQSPGTYIANSSLDKKLQLVLRRDPDEFLAQCSLLIEASPVGADARIAIFNRLEYYVESGKTKLAAVEALRFWADFPDSADRMNIRYFLTARLREGGFLLESEILGSAPGTRKFATRFLREFERAQKSESDKRIPEIHDADSALYFQRAPDFSYLAPQAEFDKENSLDEAIFWARVGRLAASDVNVGTAIDSYEKHLLAVDKLFYSGTLGADDLALVESIQGKLVHSLTNLLGWPTLVNDAQLNTPNYRGPEAAKLQIGKLSTSRVRLVLHAAVERGELTAGKCAAIINDHVAFLEGLDLDGSILMAYEMFLDRFPNSSEAPKFLLRKGLKLYALKNYQDATETLNKLFASSANRDQKTTGRYLFALSESGMGLQDESIAHMRDIVDSSYEHPVIPKALFWLGSQSLGRHQYPEAQIYLERVFTDYPNSQNAPKARDYFDRLTKLQAVATGS